MSTLKTNTIQHLTSGFNNVIAHTDGAGTANAVHCRAWISFNGTGTVAINASFNVSTLTDNGTGDYTVTLSNAMTDANYCVNCIGDFDGVNLNVITTTPLVLTSSTIRVRGHAFNANTAYDTVGNWISIFR